VLWADVVLAEPWGAYSVQVFITTRAPWRRLMRAAGQRAIESDYAATADAEPIGQTEDPIAVVT